MFLASRNPGDNSAPSSVPPQQPPHPPHPNPDIQAILASIPQVQVPDHIFAPPQHPLPRPPRPIGVNLPAVSRPISGVSGVSGPLSGVPGPGPSVPNAPVAGPSRIFARSSLGYVFI